MGARQVYKYIYNIRIKTTSPTLRDKPMSAPLHPLYIGGEWLDGPRQRDNLNPSDTRDVIGRYAQADVALTERAIAAAARRGYDLTPLRARQLTPEDFTRFDLILAMDRSNLRGAEARRPDGAGARVELFLSLIDEKGPGAKSMDVPDPWYTGDFDGTLDLIEAGCRAFIRRLAQPAQ